MKLAVFGLIALTASGQFIFRLPVDGGGDDPPACTATISSGTNLNTSISGRSAGDVLCLNTGTYSTGTTLTGWTKSPSVTVRPADGATVTISSLTFSSAVSGVTFDAEVGSQNWFSIGSISVSSTGTKSNLLLKGVNSTSTTGVFLTVDGIVSGTSGIEYFTANNVVCSFAGGTDWRIIFGADGTNGTQLFSLKHGSIIGGGADGVRFGGSAGGIIEDVYFQDVEEDPGTEDDCHSDAVQVYGGQGGTVRDSYFYSNVVGIAAYDGTQNFTIEDNILDNGDHGRPWAIEWYSDDASVIDHNTVVHRTVCGSDGCGEIDITAKPADDAGVNTIVRNNIASAITDSNSRATHTQTNNLVRSGATGSDITGSPTYTGVTNPTTVAGFALNGGLGINGATDGANIGARIDQVLAGLVAPLFQTWALTVPPPPPGMPASFAAWQARRHLKAGDLATARVWVDTARSIQRQGGVL